MNGVTEIFVAARGSKSIGRDTLSAADQADNRGSLTSPSVICGKENEKKKLSRALRRSPLGTNGSGKNDLD